jgi:membrane protein DedA with SNARE-associated domain
MTAVELLDHIEARQSWVYALLLAYTLAKTGPLLMAAGFVSGAGALHPFAVMAVGLAGTLLGSQLRYWLGRTSSARLFVWLPRAAPWLALGAVAVERFCWWLLPLYRFSKGTYNLVGLGAGVSTPYKRFVVLDCLGGVLWVVTLVGVGRGLWQLGLQVQPEWAAYFGLGLLCLGVVATVLMGRRLKTYLFPYAQAALQRYRTA